MCAGLAGSLVSEHQEKFINVTLGKISFEQESNESSGIINE